jgi:hypothetical protein
MFSGQITYADQSGNANNNGDGKLDGNKDIGPQ